MMRCTWLGGLRVIVLDSTVPGEGFGGVTGEQLEWLAEVLATPALEGSILALHHPPVPCVQDMAITVELRDQQQLAPVLAGSDIRAIIGAHLHSTFASFEGIPVSVAAATCYTQDLFRPERGTRGRDAAQAISLIGLYEHAVVHTVLPIDRGPGVGRESRWRDDGRVAGRGGAGDPAARDQIMNGTIAILAMIASAKSAA